MTFGDKEANLHAAFHTWWNGLTDASHNDLRRQRGPLAHLRRIDLVSTPAGRAPDVLSALLQETFRELIAMIQPLHDLKGMQGDRIEDLVTAAVTLAQLRENVPRGTTARLLGGAKDEGRVMKESRFLALMRADTPADLFDQARRLPDLLKGKAPVGELGASLLLWRTTPSVRRDWARDYYHLDLFGREYRLQETQGAAPVDVGV